MAVVGIDLGTTNTVIAAVRDGRAAALKDKLGKTLLPSVVSFPPKGDPKIGYEAKDRRTIDPENTVFSIKRLIGRTWDSEHVQKAIKRFPFELHEGPGKAAMVRCRGEDHSLPEISALVLARAREIAEGRLGKGVTDAVITVPANFNDLQRAATKVAGRTAGLQVLRILNEPTAAALAYGFGKKGRERIAVYDFGGGTFDVTLLDLSENVFEVLATAGDTFLGGDDLDLAIVNAMAEELLKKHRIDMDGDNLVREQLRAAAETLKVDLSTRSMAKVRVEEIGFAGGNPVHFEFSMRRSEFEKLAEPFISRTLTVCQEALEVAGVTPKDLDQVLLVGGSTRIPLVRRRISTFFGKMPQSRINPDEVVAIGAAIQASALESKMGVSEMPGAPRPQSRAPGTRSAFPSSPDLDQDRLKRTTQTGLAGLKSTLSGTGSVRPSAPPRTEGSVLSALPTSKSSSPGPQARGLMSTLSGVGPEPSRAEKMKTLTGVGEDLGASGAGPQGLHKTLSGVGDQSKLQTARGGMKTLSGVGSADEVAGPQTLTGLGVDNARGPRTLTGIGKPPSAEDLAQLRHSSAPPPLPPPEETEDVSFDDVTSIIALPDESAVLADELAVESERSSQAIANAYAERSAPDAKPDGDGSVVFDLAELEASAGEEIDQEADDQDAQDLSDIDSIEEISQLTELSQITELSQVTELDSLEDDFNLDDDQAEDITDLPAPSIRPDADEEADLPSLSRPPPRMDVEEEADLPSLSERPPAGRTPSGEMRLGFQKTMLGASAGAFGGVKSAPTPIDLSASSLTEINEADFDDETRILGQGPSGLGQQGSSLSDGSGLHTAIGEALKSSPDLSAELEERTHVSIPPGAGPGRAPLLLDVTPLALGVEVVGGYVDTLIERNSPIPCERTRVFATARDEQTHVVVRVSQGDQNRFEANTVLGQVELSGLTPGPRGSVKVEISFALDESGILQVSARDLRTGLDANAHLRLIGISENA